MTPTPEPQRKKIVAAVKLLTDAADISKAEIEERNCRMGEWKITETTPGYFIEIRISPRK